MFKKQKKEKKKKQELESKLCKPNLEEDFHNPKSLELVKEVYDLIKVLKLILYKTNNLINLF